MPIKVAAPIMIAIAIVVVILLSFATSPSITAMDATNNELVARGKVLYAANCATDCHGANLEGQPNWRKPLEEGGLPAPPHDETGHTWHHDDALLFKYTKMGGAAIAPPGFQSRMPGFGETLSDEEIWAVLSYIKSTWPLEAQRRQEQRNKN